MVFFLFCLIILECFLLGQIFGYPIYRTNILAALWLGVGYLLPLLFWTTIAVKIAVKFSNGSEEKLRSKKVEILLLLLILFYLVNVIWFFGTWHRKLIPFLHFFIPLLMAFGFIIFFFKIGKTLSLTFKKLIFHLSLLFGIPFLIWFLIFNYLTCFYPPK